MSIVGPCLIPPPLTVATVLFLNPVTSGPQTALFAVDPARVYDVHVRVLYMSADEDVYVLPNKRESHVYQTIVSETI